MNANTFCCCIGCPPTTDTVKAAIIATPLGTYTGNFTSRFDGLVHGMGEWVGKQVFNTMPQQTCNNNPCNPWGCPLEGWVINKHSNSNTLAGRLMPWNFKNDDFNPLLSCGIISTGGNHDDATMRPILCDADCSPCYGPPSMACGVMVQGLVDQGYTVNGFNSTVAISITDNINQNTLPQVATMWCPPAGQIIGVPSVVNLASKKQIFTNATNPLSVQTVTVKKQIRLYYWNNNSPYPPDGDTLQVGKCLALVFGVYVKAKRPWFNVSTGTVMNPAAYPDDELSHWVTYTSYWNGTDTAAQWIAKPFNCSSVSWDYKPCPFGASGNRHWAMPYDESTYLVYNSLTPPFLRPMHTSGTNPECGIYVDNYPSINVTGIGCVWSDTENNPFLGVVKSAISGDCNSSMNPIISSFQPNLSAPSTINIT